MLNVDVNVLYLVPQISLEQFFFFGGYVYVSSHSVNPRSNRVAMCMDQTILTPNWFSYDYRILCQDMFLRMLMTVQRICFIFQQ